MPISNTLQILQPSNLNPRTKQTLHPKLSTKKSIQIMLELQWGDCKAQRSVAPENLLKGAGNEVWALWWEDGW